MGGAFVFVSVYNLAPLGITDNGIRSVAKGIRKGVISDSVDDQFKLGRYADGSFRTGFGDPIDLTNEHQLLKLYDAPGARTIVGDTVIYDTAVLKAGHYSSQGDVGFGWAKIVAKGHHDDIMIVFGLPDNDMSVKALIGRTLRDGQPDPLDPYAIVKAYWSPRQARLRELRVIFGQDSPGSISTAYPGSP